MGKLKDFICDWFENDQSAAVRFVNKTVRLVRIGKHWWDGRRKITDGAVQVGDHAVGDEAATRPSWKLVPKELRSEFQSFQKAVEDVVSVSCITSVVSDNETRPLVFGSGVYAVDANLWPRLREELRSLQTAWDEAANSWCTEDGYKRLHAQLKDQVGEKDYEFIGPLVPKADDLRRRFWLEVSVLPFRLSEEVGDADELSGRARFIAETIEATVKGPRDEAAAAWRGFAEQIVTVDRTSGSVSAYRPTRHNPDGTVSHTARRLRGTSVLAAHRVTRALDRCARFHDPDLIGVLPAILSELTDDESTATRIATDVNTNDAKAVDLGRLFLAAADVAEDETRMCSGVAAALTAAR